VAPLLGRSPPAATPAAQYLRVRQALPFWESTLKAPNFVLSIIAHGYNGPANAGEPTNALALRGRFEGAVRFDSDEQRRFWAESLAPKRLAQGAWILCKRTDVVCTAPMFLVQKSTPGEFRDIHDLRELNEGLAPPHFRLDSLDDVAMLLGRGWLMATLDLESAYHHVELSPAFRRFVAFDWRRGHWPAAAAAEAAVDRTGGTPLAAVCTVLPFGMSTSPWVYTRVVKPLLEHWRRKGIMCVLFYDDLLVMAPARSRMDWARAEVVKDLTCAGVSINWKKSQWEPCQVCIYLGFEIDSLAGQFRLPEAKRHRLVGQLRQGALTPVLVWLWPRSRPSAAVPRRPWRPGGDAEIGQGAPERGRGLAMAAQRRRSGCAAVLAGRVGEPRCSLPPMDALSSAGFIFVCHRAKKGPHEKTDVYIT
jgi:hypothetical protein